MTHSVTTQAADARPDSTIPFQATSSKNSGGEITHFLSKVSPSALLWSPVRESEKESVTWGKCTQARPVAASSLISTKSPLCCSLHDPLAAKSPRWLYQLERPALATVWARAAVAADFRALAHWQSVWVSQTQPPHLQGWTAQTQQAGSGGQAQSMWQHLESTYCRSPGF